MSPTAAAVLAALRARGATLAVAESLTGGALAAAVTAVPGASAVFRGGVVAYASVVKVSLLDVPDEVVSRYGVVSAATAEAMATAARRRFEATYALSTTGVAGPDRQEDQPVGTVHVGCAGPVDAVVSESLLLVGSRQQIRAQTCTAALALLRRTVEGRGTGAGS
ncbi:MAG: nicotinamide-nucleotide amidohydrolase family protein [Actinomycetota bacterium]|nr:nicotinamide-nucleotide amidohydrolase family protein [Actinomycetota bacterium]